MADSEVSDSSGNHESDTSRANDYHGYDRDYGLNGRPNTDISDLERDTNILARKAKKRLVGSFNGRSENIIEKFVGWLRRKKISKIQCMLDSLFPKLKHSEEEIKDWVTSVRERKEAAAVFGRVLLTDLDHQLALYQTHMEFLDEVINDVRQLDYDVVREISELKVALHFNQELIKKSRDINVHAVETTILATEGSIGRNDDLFVSSAPGKMQRVGGSLSNSSEAEVGNEPIVSGSDDGPKLIRRSDDASESMEHIDSSLNAVVWDGAESKRKSLVSRSISINGLPLSQNDVSPTSSRLERSSSEKLGFSRFMKRKGTKSLISSIFLKPKATDQANVSLVQQKEPKIEKSILSRISYSREKEKGTGANAVRMETTPMRQRADSNSSSVSSSSETPTRISSDTEPSNSPATASLSSFQSLSGSKKKYKNGRDNAGLKLSSFLQIIPDEIPVSEGDQCDSDEEELIRRINKCLSLKGILRVILKTIQETQEIESSTLRKMRLLKKELSLLVDAGHISPFSEFVLESTNLIEAQMLTLGLSSRIDGPVAIKSEEFHNRTSSTPTLRNIAVESDPLDVGHFSKEDATGGSESDLSQNCSDDSRPFYSEPSNGSDGPHSPHIIKFSHILNDETIRSLLPPFPSEARDSMSIASSSSHVDNSFHETAIDFIDDLKVLVLEEQLAVEKLAKLQSMLNSASHIDAKLKSSKEDKEG